ncbi:MAG: hypothetical protein VB934_06885, partial [Polyangiaceae bacterium]
MTKEANRNDETNRRQNVSVALRRAFACGTLVCLTAGSGLSATGCSSEGEVPGERCEPDCTTGSAGGVLAAGGSGAAANSGGAGGMSSTSSSGATGGSPPTKPGLGDLTVDPSRIPDSHPFDETVYHDAQNWPEIDATCTSAPCASGRAPMPASWGCSPANPAANGQQDATKIDCAVDHADPKTVVWLPKGTYEMGAFGASPKAITMSKSNIVLRCEDPNQTTFMIFDKRRRHQCKDEQGVWNADLCGAMAVSIAASDMFGNAADETSWVNGYAPGETEIDVADTSIFAQGDWVMLQMDKANTNCEFIDAIPSQGTGALNINNTLNHYGKVVSVSGNTLTIDRGLRMDYTTTTCGAKTVRKITPIENVGVESCGFETSTLTPQQAFGKSNAVAVAAATGTWLVGNRFTRFDEHVVQYKMTMRNWFQGNQINDVQGTLFNTEGLYIAVGAADNVVENNAFIQMAVSMEVSVGAEGNIAAYNYVRGAGSIHWQNSLFTHGRYVRESLWEGNDVDGTMISADHRWGRNGPRITLFRNRILGSGRKASLATGRDKDGPWPVATDLNWIGNTSAYFLSYPPTNKGFPESLNPAHDMDNMIENLLVEKNVYREPFGFQIDSPDTLTDCGTGVGDCPGSNPGSAPTQGTNVEGTAAPASWSNDQIPHSLYRTTKPPTWWCQEACVWDDVHQGIGAWGDDHTGALCKLPAQ